MTLQTIADRVGVSRMTVSNAYSRPDQLSTELRTRILATAAELGYTGPDPAARGLARGRAGTVGIVLTESLAWAFQDEVAARFVGAVATELGPSDLALTILTSSADGDFIPARDVALDGAVVYLLEEDAPALDWLTQRRVPLVFVDHKPRDGFDNVNIDDREGARIGAKHLVDLGHRRIHIIASAGQGPTRLATNPLATHAVASLARLEGWHDVLEQEEIVPLVTEANLFEADAGAVAAGLLLDDDPSLTAILCFSDVLAAGAIREACHRGLHVPDDVSIVGFDGTQLGASLTPSLTTIRQDVDAKGKAAARALVGRIEDRSQPDQQICIPVELVIGGSTARPRTAADQPHRDAGGRREVSGV